MRCPLPQANGSRSYVEIPLHADVEFFRMLTSELETLDTIQANEENRLKAQVIALGNMLSAVSMPKRFNPKSDIYAWREIFRIYVESGVFFSTSEASEKVRSADKAQEQLVAFGEKIQSLGLVKSFKNKESTDLLEEFLNINGGLLRLLRFQEINKTAMRKILKSTCIFTGW
jgi:E3 ubiquitin-protein ligase BAH